MSDFCLIDREIKVTVAARDDQDDPGNKLDTDATVDRVLEHNAALRKVCGNR